MSVPDLRDDLQPARVPQGIVSVRGHGRVHELYAVLEHRGPEHARNAVALHVSYSQSDGRKFVAVVEFELETAVVGRAGRCDDQCEQAMMQKRQHDALWTGGATLRTTAIELGTWLI